MEKKLLIIDASPSQDSVRIPMGDDSFLMTLVRFPECRRRVLFVGPSGVGKSTIINFLFHDEINPRYCIVDDQVTTYPAYTFDGIVSGVTKSFYSYYSPTTKLYLTDSIGFGDKDISREVIIGSIKDLLISSSRGYNKIYFVLKDRLSGETSTYIDFLIALFGSDLRERLGLIMTHQRGNLTQEQWLNRQSPKDKEMLQRTFSSFLLGNFQVETDNPHIDEHFEPIRRRFLNAIKEDIYSSPETCIFLKIKDLKSLWIYISKTIQQLFFPEHPLSDFTQNPLQKLHLTCCPFCNTAIYLSQDVMNSKEHKPVTTRCGHIYHSQCFIFSLLNSPFCYCSQQIVSRSGYIITSSGPPYKYFVRPPPRPNVSIEVAVESALMAENVPKESIEYMTEQVNNHCKRDRVVRFQSEHHLTEQELKAILYYMVSAMNNENGENQSLYTKFNRQIANRSTNITIWKNYMYYLLEGLMKLPAWKGTVYRGVTPSILARWKEYHQKNQAVLIITVMSTNKTQKTLKTFSNDRDGTWMVLEVIDGRDVSRLSFYDEEEEIIVLPNTSFRITSLNKEELKGQFGGVPSAVDLIAARQESCPTIEERKKVLGF
eukprot:TRINITY_DN17306_c0_g1_i1.p1 TRINITY_DN17306_c0_g1~~TRINITY_DN17306_c0_g1_i1.p1  ORF type:complete len:600 (-),score=103.03 TRINITY_DN17306_c0_g1_i1:25-1824(-)